MEWWNNGRMGKKPKRSWMPEGLDPIFRHSRIPIFLKFRINFFFG
jgi:hypothetical protein